jgi:phage shock protein A
MGYTNYSVLVMPQISRRLEQAAEVEGTVDHEQTEQGRVCERIQELNDVIRDLSRQIAELRGGIQAERMRKQRIDMETFKLKLKGRLRPAAA